MLNKVSIKTVLDRNDLFFYLPGLNTYDLLQRPAARRVSHVHTSEQRYCSVDCRLWPVEKLLGKHTSQWHVNSSYWVNGLVAVIQIFPHQLITVQRAKTLLLFSVCSAWHFKMNEFETPFLIFPLQMSQFNLITLIKWSRFSLIVILL